MKKKTKYFWVDDTQNLRLFKYKNKASFYASKAWAELREYKLNENPFCEECEKQGILLIRAIDCDHIIPIAENDLLALDPENVQCLCKSCHYKKTANENRERDQPTKKGGIINKKWNID